MNGYRPGDRLRAPLRDRVAAGAGAAACVALLGVGLVFGLAVGRPAVVDRALAVIDVPLRPPPPPTPPPVEVHRPKAAKRPAAPRALKARATPVVAPPPIVIPPPTPVIVAAKPAQGAASHSGASDRPGPGQGAGGRGEGDGGGGDGGDGDFTPPRFLHGDLHSDDLPEDLRDRGQRWFVAVRYTVGIDGRVSGCGVTRSSGNAELDTLVCRLIEERYRFRPARDEDGRPVAVKAADTHEWAFDDRGDPERP